jgi:hypothetical protein
LQPNDAARATAQAIGELGGAFMLDGATYARGAEIGFGGLDFYVLGRGGALGDTHGDVVAAAFVFWNPEQVTSMWASGREVMAPDAAGAEWVSLCAAYGEANLPDVEGLERFNELAGRVVDAASPSVAPIFAGWRAQEAPGADRPKARAQHLLNALRELRGAVHGGAVLAAGLTGQEALAFRAPHMAAIFGWDPEALPDAASVKERWKVAEAGTDAAFGLALTVLDEAERAEFVELVNAVHAARQSAQTAGEA